MQIANLDYLIVGSGLSGSVLARKLAQETDARVGIVERRAQVGGNLYDTVDEAGILVQQYGPHIFHTNDDSVYQFITQFAKWQPFKLNCSAVIDGVTSPMPFNFTTIDLLYEEAEAGELKARLTKAFPSQTRVTIFELLNSGDEAIVAYVNKLIELDYRPYTAKQWGIAPEALDMSVLERVPVALNYDDVYFADKYECMPEGGFAAFVQNMLDHPNITVETKVDALEHLRVDVEANRLLWDGKLLAIPLIYTGAIDELLAYRFGVLPYRSLHFEYETLNQNNFQAAPVTAYPQAPDFTRITEYKKLPTQSIKGKTTIAREYPRQFDPQTPNSEPYYPIPNEANTQSWQAYYDILKTIDNLVICGRLADYRYYNMDQVILRAFAVFNEIIAKEE